MIDFEATINCNQSCVGRGEDVNHSHMPERFKAWLTINRACNLRCSWCYAKSKGFAQSEEMSVELAFRLIEFLRTIPVRNIVLIGGEPTIHPHFLKIVAMIRDAGLISSLVTNAVKFENREFLEQTIQAGVGSVLTSIKAGDETGYRESTGVSGAFQRVVEGIRNVEESSLPQQVCVTMCEGIFDQFPTILQAVRSSGAKRLLIDTERPVILESEVTQQESPDCKNIARFLIESYSLLIKSGLEFAIKLSIPFCNLPSDFIDTLIERKQLLAGCQIYSGSGVILDPLGRLLACNQMCESPLGAFGIDFTDVASFYQFRESEEIASFYRDMTCCPDKLCVNCRYWQICGGGCKMRWLCAGADQLLGDFQGKGE